MGEVVKRTQLTAVWRESVGGRVVLYVKTERVGWVEMDRESGLWFAKVGSFEFGNPYSTRKAAMDAVEEFIGTDHVATWQWISEHSRLARENRELKEELALLNASIAKEREAHDLTRRAFSLFAEARR